jgi:outer membrane lipoprotein-sorting protein
MVNKMNIQNIKTTLSRYAIVALAIIIPAALFAQSKPSTDEILKAIDNNLVALSISYDAKMIIHRKNRTDVKEMQSWGEGREKGYTVFTGPARDKGTKYLKLEDDLWMYIPSIESVKTASDSLERGKLHEDYSAEMLEDEQVNGSSCYVLELTAMRKDVTYYRRKIWVDKEKLVPLKSERYAKTGKLMKVMLVLKTEFIANKYYPVHISLEDKLRKNSKTEMILENIKLDIEIDPSVFTRRNLEKK